MREFLEMRPGREAKLFRLCGDVPGLGLGRETGAHAMFQRSFLRTKLQSDDFPVFLRKSPSGVRVSGGKRHLDHGNFLTPLPAELGALAHGKGRGIAVRIIGLIRRSQRNGCAPHGEDARQPPPDRNELLSRFALGDSKA
jgi:hypothetical protein